MFVPAELNGDERTMAELSQEEKDEISHRGRAFRALKEVLDTAREAKVKYGLSTSFGFGGQNGALVMAAV